MLKAILAATLVSQAPVLATIMVTPPSGGSTTVFVLPGNAYDVTQALVLGQFTVTGSPSFAYANSDTYLLGPGTTSWSPSGSPFDWISPNGGTRTVTINLGGSYTRVGGFFNYENYSNPYIEALDANQQLISETTYYLASAAPISTPWVNNDGAFRGIDVGAANIHYFRISGPILMHSITIDGGSLDPVGGGDPSDTPEPPTIGLVLIAAAAIMARRRTLASGHRSLTVAAR